MYFTSSTRGPNRLLQEAYQEFGVPILPSFYHVNLRKSTFTEATVHFLLRTFPNIEHLELVQIAPDKHFNSCLQLIIGLSKSLKSLFIYHEKDHELVYWEDASKPNSLGTHSRVWARNHLKTLLTAPRRLLANISQSDYPHLKHIALVDLTMYSKATPLIIAPSNFSHMESLYFVQPFDSTFFRQTLAIQEPWKNLKNLAIQSNVLDLQRHIDQNCEYNAVQETLANLKRFTISGLFPYILTHLNVCTTNLVHLHIHDLKLKFNTLLPMLVSLKGLRTIRIYFDIAVVTNNFTIDPKDTIVQLPSVEVLQLSNTEIIHQPCDAATCLSASLPNLRTLILEPDSSGNRQLRNHCRRCQNVPHQVSQFCKSRFIHLAFRNRRGRARFEHLKSIKINCVNYRRNDLEIEWFPQWLEWYEVWKLPKAEWEMEQILF